MPSRHWWLRQAAGTAARVVQRPTITSAAAAGPGGAGRPQLALDHGGDQKPLSLTVMEVRAMSNGTRVDIRAEPKTLLNERFEGEDVLLYQSHNH